MNYLKKTGLPSIVLALLNIVFGCLGTLIMGQYRKAVLLFLFHVIFVWVGIGIITLALSIIDCYLTAEKVHADKLVESNEYSLEVLYKIMSIFDSTAVYKK